MIVALLLATAQSASPQAMPEDVVVLARKLRYIGVSMKAPKRNGTLQLRACQITRPSGDAELDAVPCSVAQECVPLVATRKALVACVEERSRGRLDAIAAARRERS